MSGRRTAPPFSHTIATAEPWTLLLNGIRRWWSWGKPERPRPMRDWHVSCPKIAVEASNGPWRGSREALTKLRRSFLFFDFGALVGGLSTLASGTVD